MAFTTSGSPGCALCRLSTLLFGDPHLYGFEGERFDLHGEADKCYNLLSDTYIQVNALFASWNADPVGTIIKKIGIKLGTTESFNYFVMENDGLITHNGERLEKKVVIDLEYKGFLGSAEVETTFAGVDLPIADIKYAGTFENILLNLNLPTYNIKIIKASEPVTAGSPYFLNFLAHIMNKNVRPHGIVGQTADFDGKPRESAGHQGEGVIEGVYTDYEVTDLMADDFKFNRFSVFERYAGKMI